MSQIEVSASESRLKETTEIQEMRPETVSGLHELHDIVSAVKNEVPLDSIEKSIRVPTRNNSLEGKEHPATGVPFVLKEVETDTGKFIEVVVPDFSEHTAFETNLPESMYTGSDYTQFSYCNTELKNAFDEGKLDESKFSERQLEQIRNGDQPQGFTWHHNEEKGCMQLVDSAIHDQTAHTGGKSIWGGGSNAR